MGVRNVLKNINYETIVYGRHKNSVKDVACYNY